jgi:UDP-glucose 4-epimerase
MKLLVTGGLGYIGSHTVVALQQDGHDVVVIDNLCNSSSDVAARIESVSGKPFTCIEADVADKAALAVLFARHAFDGVIHFAGLKAVGESVAQPLRYYQHNLGTTMALLEAMSTHGVRQLVFSSSATVYGDPASVPIREDAPLRATNPYGRSKLMIEDMLRDLALSDGGWRIALLRYFNPVGAHESGLLGEAPNGIPNNLMPYIAQVAAGRRDKLAVFGDDYPTHDGTGLRDYIHVVDLAHGHVRALAVLAGQAGNGAPGNGHAAHGNGHAGTGNGHAVAGNGHAVTGNGHGGAGNGQGRVHTYNLGRGTGSSVLDMVRAFEQASGRPVPYEVVPRRPGDIAACYANPALAEQELGWRAERGIKQMCIDAWRWQCQLDGAR